MNCSYCAGRDSVRAARGAPEAFRFGDLPWTIDVDGMPDWASGGREHDRECAVRTGRRWFEAAGRVERFSGRTSRILLAIQGGRQRDGWGASVCAAGDVNRDGIADVLVGKLLVGKDRRELWILYGRFAGCR